MASKKKVSTECTKAVEKKRGRGRPRKATKESNTECLKKVSTESKNVKKRGRGRPRKVSVESNTECLIDGYPSSKGVRELIYLGICSSTECTNGITNADYIVGKKTKVRCTRCGTECLESQLKDKPSKKSRKGKKAYLDKLSGIHPENDYASTYEPDIPVEFVSHTQVQEDWDA